jgi:hypothetical protein
MVRTARQLASPAGAPASRQSATRHWLAFGVAATIASALAVAIVYRTPLGRSEWPAVALWAGSLALWLLACRAPAEERVHASRPRPAELAAMALLAGAAAAVILPGLEFYPLETIGDPVRDSGLLARSIAQGETREIFRYGFYFGYSMVVPLLGAPFHLLFPASSLTFKGLAALLGILTPPLFFWFARRYLSFALALTAALLLATLPVYLFYARREPVVAFSPLVMTAVLAALVPALEPAAPLRRFGLIGLAAGVSVFFHAAVKGAGLAAFTLAMAVALWRSCAGRQSWQRTLAAAAVAVLGFIIAFGPLLEFTDPDILVSRARLGTPEGAYGSAALLERYLSSLRIYFDQPTMSWFPKHQPLIPSPWLAALFTVGALAGGLVVPARAHWTMLFFALVLPFTNSALTDTINADHRLAPLLPVLAFSIAMGIGVVWRALDRLRSRTAAVALRAAVIALCGVVAALGVYRFFAEQQARRGDLNNHLVYFGVREVKSNPRLRVAPELCVGGNRWTTQQMGLLHVLDGWRFFLPGQTVTAAELRPSARENELYVSTTCEGEPAKREWVGKLYCSGGEPFICPDQKDVRIYVDARDAAAE